MAVALIMDFPGGTKANYDEVIERMGLGGHMPAGGLFHAAGSYEGGWRVIDVWEDMDRFARFRDESIGPHTQAAGMQPPNVRVVEVESVREASGEPAALVQVVNLPGLDSAAFHAADDTIIPGGRVPEAMTFHVSGPSDGGWCVVDAWTSREARDRFIEERVRPAMADAPLSGPPSFEDLDVEATLVAGAAAPQA